MQRRLLLEVSAAGVDQVGMGVEQSREVVDAALVRGVEDGVDRLLHLRRAAVPALEVADQQLDRLVPELLGDLVNGAAVVVGRAGVEAGLEGAPHRLDVTGARRVEDPLAFRCGEPAPMPSTWALRRRQLAKP